MHESAITLEKEGHRNLFCYPGSAWQTNAPEFVYPSCTADLGRPPVAHLGFIEEFNELALAVFLPFHWEFPVPVVP